MTRRKPLIGIPYSENAVRDEQMKVRTYVSRKYYRAIQEAGARAILLPPVSDNSDLLPLLEMLDGLMLAGGEDIDPRFQDEDPQRGLDSINPWRDEFEIELTKLAWKCRLPVLGICRGIQVMAVALGGKIYQDISNGPFIQHTQKAPRWATSHKVTLDKKSLLYKWIGQKEIFTNSFHHQAVKEFPDCIEVVARTSDGLIEAIQAKDNRIFTGVQWHPEELAETDEIAKKLFLGFVSSCNTDH